MSRIIYLLAALLLITSWLPSQESPTTSAEFAAKAYATVPVEESYAFHRALSEWHEPLRRDPSARPSTHEIALPEQGWTLLIRSDAGIVLQQAAVEFSDYLERSMQTQVRIEKRTSLADWATLKKAIVASIKVHGGDGSILPDWKASRDATMY